MAAEETIEELDDDINDLHARIATLRAQRASLASVLLSQPDLTKYLRTSADPTQDKTTATVHHLITQQERRNTENIYRACAGVTAYRVQDPDPHAVNNGNILGVSIDVSLGGRFIETYHVLLNSKEQDDAGNKLLRIHKHTIPLCIPLQQLAQKWLQGTGEKESREQDLVRFGKALRKELVAWHLRVQAVADLRKDAKVDKQKEDDKIMSGSTVLNAFVTDDEASSDVEVEEQDPGSSRIVEIEADTAVRQISITWSDRRTASMYVTKDGRIEKAVCRTKGGARDTALGRKAVGPLQGLARRLLA